MRQLILIAAVCVLVVCGASSQVRAELITNGGFETGTFSGWTVGTTQTDPFEAALFDGQNSQQISAGAGGYSWFVRDKPANYFGVGNIATPISGFSAFNGFDGSQGYFFLRQNFSTTDLLDSAILSFDYAVQSQYSGNPRVFTANILDSSGSTQLASVYSYTQATGNLPAWNPNNINLDLAPVLNSLGAGNYQLEFRIDIPQFFTGPAQFAIDNISLQVELAAVPEPASLSVFSICMLGAFGAARRRRKQQCASREVHV